MKHFKNLLNESVALTVFEMLNRLQGFLEEKYDIKTFGAKRDNGFIMFMSKYVTGNGEEKDISEAIEKFVSKECNLENVSVVKADYGYHITFGENPQSAKLVETTQAHGTGMADSKVTYKCAFCDEEHEGYGNDGWPLDMSLESRVCDVCNEELVIPARLNMLYNRTVKAEATRGDIESSASNIVLDDKFIWLFSVLDENGNDIEEGIEYLKDAIDLLIKDSAAFLVAFPYVDPKPEDDSVDIVFADNPGPVIIYNNEQATMPKSDIKKPSTEEQPKPQTVEDEEETIEESTENYKVFVFDVVLPGIKTGEDSGFTIDVPSLENVRDNIEKEIVERYGTDYELIESYEWEVEGREELNESWEDEHEPDYIITVEMTEKWYDEFMGDNMQVYEAVDRMEDAMEEEVSEYGFVGLTFHYVGDNIKDFESSPLSYNEGKDVKQILENEFGDWLHIRIVRRPF